jgi:integrase
MWHLRGTPGSWSVLIALVLVVFLDRCERANPHPSQTLTVPALALLGLLFCWENGLPPHPDTITSRFKKLSRAAGLLDIDLHDVRRSYLTAGRKARIDWKALSQRVGHSDVAFTMRQYVETDLEADREVANTLAELIIAGTFSSDLAARPGPDGEDQGDEDPAA